MTLNPHHLQASSQNLSRHSFYILIFNSLLRGLNVLAVILPLKCVSDTLVFNFYSVKRSPLYQYGGKLATFLLQPPVAGISSPCHHTQLLPFPLAFTYVFEDIVNVPTLRERFLGIFIEIVLKQICEANSFFN